MEKFLVSPNEISPKPKRISRRRWERAALELNGRIEPNYRHGLSSLLMQSYSEVGKFPHNGPPCRIQSAEDVDSRMFRGYRATIKRQGISALEFDSKGVYLASVTKSGCLTVHDFEALYCRTKNSSPLGVKPDDGVIVAHISKPLELNSIRWNPFDEDKVACASTKSDEVLLFDLTYVTSEPTETLRTRRNVTAAGSISKGLSDIAFSKANESRLIASDTDGVLHVWDKRKSRLPCLELTTNSYGAINSIQLSVDSEVVFGAGKQGIIYSWDLRGGKSSASFQTQNVVRYSPLTYMKLSSMLADIRSLKAQTNIYAKEIHSISLDPCCPYQLAFHIDDGWSGVLDLHSLRITHVHCPPYAWLNGSRVLDDRLHLRKGFWLPTQSIYVVGSTSESGIHMLDFYPHRSSPSHVDNEEMDSPIPSENSKTRHHQFIPTSSEAITVCTAHPLNSTIVAGTEQTSLLMISQESMQIKPETNQDETQSKQSSTAA